MTEFLWKQAPDGGFCITCMSQSNDRGFVDFISEANVVRDNFEITGVIDVYLCGSCLEQAARLVGCASRDEVNDLVFSISERDTEIEKLKDEVMAWQQRIMQLASLDLSDFKRLAQLEAEENGTPTPAQPIP